MDHASMEEFAQALMLWWKRVPLASKIQVCGHVVFDDIVVRRKLFFQVVASNFDIATSSWRCCKIRS